MGLSICSELTMFVRFNVICRVDKLISNLKFNTSSIFSPAYVVSSKQERDGQVVEALEFWHVSKRLYDKLYERGELVTDEIFDFYIWGRTRSGQDVSLDPIISEIYDEI